MSSKSDMPELEMSLVDRLVHEVRETVGTILIIAPFFLIFTTFAWELRSIPSESMVPNLQVGDRVAVSKFAYGYNQYSVPYGLGRFLPIGEKRFFAKDPKRGDVVVFRHPHLDRVMVKRLVGMPGDSIQMQNGRLIVNGEPLEHEFLRRAVYDEFSRRNGRRQSIEAAEMLETNPDGESYVINDYRPSELDNTSVFIVPENHAFFMGDNRDNSTDARAVSGHCPTDAAGVISEAGCTPRPGWQEPSIGFVPFDHLIGRADTVLFTFYFCQRYETGCPQGRVWKSL